MAVDFGASGNGYRSQAKSRGYLHIGLSFSLLRRAAIVTLVVGQVFGCVDPAPRDALPLVEVTDSGGVPFVRNLDATVDAQAVELVEVLRIGNAFGPPQEQFHLVTGVATDASGRIFVVDQGTQAVRLFDQNGKFIRQFGGRGHGPGEFTLISKLFLWRDTVHVQNIEGRFTGALFDTTGLMLATYAGRLTLGALIVPLAGGPEGWFVSVDSLIGPSVRVRNGDVTRNLTTIATVRASNLERMTLGGDEAHSILHRILTYRSGRTFWRAGEDGVERGLPALFEPTPSHAIDGRGFVYVALGWPYLISVYDSYGLVVRRIARAHDSIPTDRAMVSEVLRRARSHYDTLGGRGKASYDVFERRAQLPSVGFVPVTGRMLASESGWLWVERPDLEPDPATLEWSPGSRPRPANWDVFDPTGRFQYVVKLPPDFTLQTVTAKAVVGVWRDEFNVQYIVKYHLKTVTEPPGLVRRPG